MDQHKLDETTHLLGHDHKHQPSPASLKFPLGLVSPTVRPYLELIRLEKPTGTILMFWPFVWGLTMAAHRTGISLEEYAVNVGNSFVCAFLLRSSACTVNDIFDREMDAGVERCKVRPLPSGRISVRAATVYLMVQYLLGIAWFRATIANGPILWVALFQLLPLFAIYPLLKRCTYWPQAWLSFAMNFGFITAWATTTQGFDFSVLIPAMAGCWCWTMLYDTIYACQDIKDDVKMGVRSTAILWGSWIRPLLTSCGLGFVAALSLAGRANGQGPLFYLISVGGLFGHLLFQYFTVDLEVPASCWKNFNQNGQLGWIIWGGLMLDYLHGIGKI